MSEPAKGWWACSVCRQRSDDFEPARGPGNRRGASFVVARPCGHQNPKGLTWHETPTREAAPLLCDNWPRNEVRLLVIQRRGDGRVDHLMADGMWRTEDAGVVPVEPPGLLLPPEAVRAIAEAAGRYLGNQLPSQAEVGVLREWLAVERDRVNAVLGGALDV